MKELEEKLAEFEEKAVWAGKKADADEEALERAIAKGASELTKNRLRKQAAMNQAQSDVWNEAAWAIKGIIAGYGN